MITNRAFRSWLAPFIGAILPLGMAVVGQYKQDQSILEIWKADPYTLLFMASLGFLGGTIIWVYDLVRKNINK